MSAPVGGDAVAAHTAITTVLARYAAAIDRFDLAAVEACYFPDAVEDRGRFRGPLAEFLPWLEAARQGVDGWWHQLGLPLIELDGDVAHVETTCLALHRTGAADRLVPLRYLDRFERRGGEWRIAARRAEYEPPLTVDAVD